MIQQGEEKDWCTLGAIFWETVAKSATSNGPNQTHVFCLSFSLEFELNQNLKVKIAPA